MKEKERIWRKKCHQGETADDVYVSEERKSYSCIANWSIDKNNVDCSGKWVSRRKTDFPENEDIDGTEEQREKATLFPRMILQISETPWNWYSIDVVCRSPSYPYPPMWTALRGKTRLALIFTHQLPGEETDSQWNCSLNIVRIDSMSFEQSETMRKTFNERIVLSLYSNRR